MKKDEFKKNLQNKMNKINTNAHGVYSNTPKIVEIELEKIKSNPYQPRIEYDDSKISELANSIKKQGLISPITVRKTDSGYILVSGHRRYLAYKKLDKETIPAIVKKLNDKELQTIALAENIIRENLDPLEIAIALENLLENKIAKNQAELSELLGLSESTISRYLKLVTLPKEIKDKIKTKEYTNLIVLNRLSKLPENEAIKLFNIILEKKLSRDEALELIKNANKLNLKSEKTILKGNGFKIEKKDVSTKIEINFNKLKNNKEKVDKLLSELEEILKSCTVQE